LADKETTLDVFFVWQRSKVTFYYVTWDILSPYGGDSVVLTTIYTTEQISLYRIKLTAASFFRTSTMIT